MKILYITPGCFDKGGISRYSRYQITALRDLFGHESIKVFSLHRRDSSSFENDFSVFWYAGDNSLLNKILLVYKIFIISIFWRPDFIHVAHVNFSGVCYIISKLTGSKLILNVYGHEVWSGLSFDAKLGLKKADKIISDCHFTKNYLVGAHLRKGEDIFVIWDCVDLNRFSPTEPSLEILKKYGLPDPKRYKIILTLGRLSKRALHKGYERLIKVFAELEKIYSDLFLVFGGDGDFKSNLEQLAIEHGIKDKVIFTGSIDEPDLPDVYRSAYVFSLISDRGKGRGEGIPLTPLEAMACGIPIIVGNQDGSQEAIIDNNGVVLDSLNLELHLQWFARIIEDKSFYIQLKRNALSISKTYFSYSSFKEKHSQFYQLFLR